MTQEEKAKAYDKAIKKAESLYKASESMSGCNVILETLFPELIESEDEKIRKGLIEILSKYKYFYSKEIAWLKSLKGRIQPKQEWNEEDKDYYDAIIAKLEVTQEDAALTDNQMSFLKSLRPQNRWRPSEEQLKQLETAVSKGRAGYFNNDVLRELYVQLKQL